MMGVKEFQGVDYLMEENARCYKTLMMFNGNSVVRNEVSMAFLFSAMQARAVEEDNVMKDISSGDTIAANAM